VPPDSARVEIRQYGSAIYAAADQEVAAPYLAAGSYELYCKAVIGGVVYDTTVPFGYGALYTPLTLEAAQAGAVVTFVNKASDPVTYKVNGGTGGTIASGAAGTITLAAVGDKVQFYGDNAAYATDTTDGNSSNIACNKNCYVYGNIMSLVKSDGFETETALTGNYTFCKLFKGNAYIKNKTGADLVLPATTLKYCCYQAMFQNCASFTTVPELPATSVPYQGYYSMFQGCTSLTTAPNLPATSLAMASCCRMFQDCTSLTSAPALPATTMKSNCYESMFQGCTSLASAPELPATTLESTCYLKMFSGCTSLASAPALPATTLTSSCYSSMFAGCTSLVEAPELPAKTLASNCYFEMFKGCSSLNKVTCLATNISASNCTTDWLDGVATSGTFTKAAAMNDWTIDNPSGIPAGWTVKSQGSAETVGMVLIPHGSFRRAKDAAAVTNGQVYTITLTKDFYMCDHEVTQKEFYDVMGVTQAQLIAAVSGSEDKGSGDDYPVYYVNWYHAIAYCNKLSLAERKTPCYEVTGVDFAALTFDQIPTSMDATWNKATCDWDAGGYRLPTEAEGEYAALGDYKDSSNWDGYGDSSNSSAVVFAGYNGSNSIGDYAWYSGNASDMKHEVKTTTGANSYNLCDMSGNVYEWCWDLSGSYDGADSTDPRGASGLTSRVLRGGCWGDDASRCSVAYRGSASPYICPSNFGFRVVRTAP
ncbi:MAG: SUMF1/EgtB/PvdO family nonheme iron enzyme, partial [Treponema sp.]|nr:SUMF1/EgtB/PvdO family nonheme iron enzyme [Treponema sp.]